MELITIQDSASESGPQLCRQLEAGNAIFFPRTPIEFSAEDEQFLMAQRQTEAAYHKNIAYRPAQNVLTGAAAGTDSERLRSIMKRFSEQVTRFVSHLLVPYRDGLRIDFASFRPFEEAGRKLPLHSQNDLLHFDAFPTRPTHGDRILRFFVNLNPEKPRVWLTTDGFELLATRFADEAGLREIGKRASCPVRRRIAGIGRAFKIAALSRSPYDSAMHRFHNFLKENAAFQKNCPKQRWEFPPRSSWMVYTDSVSHAVLSGQMALEQTFIVPRRLMVEPSLAPASVLERLAGGPVVWNS